MSVAASFQDSAEVFQGSVVVVIKGDNECWKVKAALLFFFLNLEIHSVFLVVLKKKKRMKKTPPHTKRGIYTGYYRSYSC